MELIRTGTVADWAGFRALRLTALTESPDAFGSTYERELGFDETTWRARVSTGSCFLAEAGDPTRRLVGTATGLVDPELPPDERLLVGMWVAPPARRTGLALRLVRTVVAWAQADGARRLNLEVGVGNQGARALYERAGFVASGAVMPMPRDPRLLEMGMVLDLT